MLTLRNGQCTTDPRLDRIRQIDLRSLDYPVSVLLDTEQYRAPRSYTWKLGMDALDQTPTGRDGSYSGSGCVGHGWAHELSARPGVVTGVTHEFALDLYYGIQRRDPWEGGEYPGAEPYYEGTSVLSGAQEVQARGWIDEYRWALTIPDLITTLGYFGPVVAGFDWYEDMFWPDEHGFIRPTGNIAGGHCVLIQGVHIEQTPELTDRPGTLDPVRSYVTIVNSWSPNWGIRGRAKIALVDLAVLWPGADMVVAVRRHSGAVG